MEESDIEICASGRTEPVLATRTRDGSPLRNRHENAAISRGKGEGAGSEGARISASDGPSTEDPIPETEAAESLRIVRASTRFEIRIRPRDREGRDIEENLRLLKTLDEVSRDIAHARNTTMRANFVADGTWLDEHPEILDAYRRGEKKLKWWGDRATRRSADHNPNGIYSYNVMRKAAPKLSTDIVASLSNNDDATWIGDRFDVLVRMSRAVRHYKSHQPIPIPHKAVKLSAAEDGSVTVTLRLQSKEAEGASRIAFRLVPRDRWQETELESLTSGEWKLGQAVLSRHPTKRGRWFVRFSYTRLVPKRTGDVTVVVRRGMRSFLVAASSHGTVREIYDGGDIIAFKKQFDARRRELGRHTRAGTMGRGGTGHGTKRRILALKDLSDKEARFCESASKRAAAALVRFAQSEGASEIVYEDFAAPKSEDAYWLVKRWPWYRLAEACVSACEASGLTSRAVVVRNDRRECPFCDHKHLEPPTSLVGQERIWTCVKCGKKRNADQIDVLSMLRAVQRGDGVERAEEKRKSAVQALAVGVLGALPKANGKKK